MQTSTHRGRSSDNTDVTSRSTAALAGTLLLLGVGYVLLVAGPVFFQRSPALLDSLFASSSAQPSWLPAAVASGLVVLGAAALLFVLARLVRDVEQHPYACLAPVLAVFSAFVLVGLRAKSVMPGIASEHFAAIAMLMAVSGGALVKQRGVLNALTGTFLAFLPAVTLLSVIWASSGKADVVAVWSASDPQLRVFAALLTGSSFAMVAIATVSRSVGVRSRVASRKQGGHAAAADEGDAVLWQELRAQSDSMPTGAPMMLSNPQFSVNAQGEPYDLERLTWSGGFPAQSSGRGTPGWLIALLSMATVCAVGAFSYRLYLRHQNEQHQAALVIAADEQRAAAQAKVLAEQRAREAEAATARLEALLAAPAATAAQPVANDPAASAPAELPPPSAPGAAAVATVEQPEPAAEQAEESAAASESEKVTAEVARKPAAESRRERRSTRRRAKARVRAVIAPEEDELFAADDKPVATKREAREKAQARSLEDDVLALVGAERKAKKEPKKPEPKLSRAEQRKLREEQKKTRAAQRAVGRTLEGGDDPIFGL